MKILYLPQCEEIVIVYVANLGFDNLVAIFQDVHVNAC